MNILRKQQKSSYTNIDNELINDYSLSFRAVGIAVYLLSKPDGWNINVKHLEQVRSEGREAIRAAMKELAEAGYIMRSQENAKDGTITTTTRIADYPAFANVGTPENRVKGYGYDDSRPTDGLPTIGANDCIVTTDLVITETKNTSPNGEVPVATASPSQQVAMFDLGVPAPPQVGAEKVKRPRAPKKEPKAYVNPITGVSTTDIMAEYVKCMETNEPGSAVAYARESKGALMLAQNGWTPQTVIECYLRMRREDFWSRKHISLHTVAHSIGSMLGAPSTSLPKEKGKVRIVDYITGEIREVDA